MMTQMNVRKMATIRIKKDIGDDVVIETEYELPGIDIGSFLNPANEDGIKYRWDAKQDRFIRNKIKSGKVGSWKVEKRKW